MINSEPTDRATSVTAAAEQRRLWCGDCRSAEVFEEIRQTESTGVGVSVELLCTACGAAYFADFEADLAETGAAVAVTRRAAS